MEAVKAASAAAMSLAERAAGRPGAPSSHEAGSVEEEMYAEPELKTETSEAEPATEAPDAQPGSPPKA